MSMNTRYFQNSSLELNFIYFIIGLSLLLRLIGIGAHDLLVEEAYYWNYAAHLDFSYLDHPPMVAILIKLLTTLFGMSEWSVRIASMSCWMLAAFFIYRWTELISKGAGRYGLMLFSILPFFFLQSLVITPDQPLIVCWAADLYFFYKALVLNESRSWYWAGFWLGVGLLSKYSIVLLGIPVIAYLSVLPNARRWFFRQEPYLAVVLALVLFSPVIYWNARHGWVSFFFQSTRRFAAPPTPTFHHFLGLLLLFLTPVGLAGCLHCLYAYHKKDFILPKQTHLFIMLFTILPLMFFGYFSTKHAIKFNWIGPVLLAMIPWLAYLLQRSSRGTLYRLWQVTSVLLLCSYLTILYCIASGPAFIAKHQFLQKYIAWDDFTRDMHKIAKEVETQTGKEPVFVPLDAYNIGSELAYYQANFLTHGLIKKVYPIVGRHIFGLESLMYRYWSSPELKDKVLILVSANEDDFKGAAVRRNVVARSEVYTLMTHAQGHNIQIKPYFYEIVQMEDRSLCQINRE